MPVMHLRRGLLVLFLFSAVVGAALSQPSEAPPTPLDVFRASRWRAPATGQTWDVASDSTIFVDGIRRNYTATATTLWLEGEQFQRAIVLGPWQDDLYLGDPAGTLSLRMIGSGSIYAHILAWPPPLPPLALSGVYCLPVTEHYQDARFEGSVARTEGGLVVRAAWIAISPEGVFAIGKSDFGSIASDMQRSLAVDGARCYLVGDALIVITRDGFANEGRCGSDPLTSNVQSLYYSGAWYSHGGCDPTRREPVNPLIPPPATPSPSPALPTPPSPPVDTPKDPTPRRTIGNTRGETPPPATTPSAREGGNRR